MLDPDTVAHTLNGINPFDLPRNIPDVLWGRAFFQNMDGTDIARSHFATNRYGMAHTPRGQKPRDPGEVIFRLLGREEALGLANTSSLMRTISRWAGRLCTLPDTEGRGLEKISSAIPERDGEACTVSVPVTGRVPVMHLAGLQKRALGKRLRDLLVGDLKRVAEEEARLKEFSELLEASPPEDDRTAVTKPYDSEIEQEC